MQLCVNSIKTVALAALMTVSMAACNKQTKLTKVSNETVPAETSKVLDSIRNENKKIVSNPNYVYLGSDTIKLNKDFAKNPQRFIDKADLLLRDNYNYKMIKYPDYVSWDVSDRIGAPKVKTEDIYIDKTPVITSEDVFTTDSKTLYVPVEYYGRVNPKTTVL